MGCWHETCGLTNLPITDGTRVRVMLITRVPQTPHDIPYSTVMDPLELFVPATVLARGAYNDYGWITFDEGEEDRFYGSAEKVKLKLARKESGPELPLDTFQWMIREDAFDMTFDLPFEYFGRLRPRPETVGMAEAAQAARLWKLRKSIDQMEAGRRVESFEDREEYNAFLAHEGIPSWPLLRKLFEYRTRGYPAELSDAEAQQNTDDLMRIYRIYLALGAMRKILVPTYHGSSPQHWNDGAYAHLGKFYAGAIELWKDGYNYE